MPSEPQQRPPASPSEAPSSTTPAQRVALIAAVLAGAAVTGAAVAGPPLLTAAGLAALTRLLLRWGYRRETVRWGLRAATLIVSTRVRFTPWTPGGTTPPPGPAQLANADAERVFAAWFLERSTARVEQAYAEGAEPGEPEAREERWIQQHLDAQEKRRKAAERVDAEAGKPGQVTDRPGAGRVILKWRAHPDDKTTPECRAADGAWFYADTPPIIGYPGMPHGGTCRCWPTHAGSLAEVARGRHVNDAVRGIIANERDHRTHPGATVTPDRRTA